MGHFLAVDRSWIWVASQIGSELAGLGGDLVWVNF